MAEFADALGEVAETDLWMQAAAVFAAFLAPTVVRNIAEGMTPFDVPDELYGVLVVFLAQYSPAYANEIRIGGSVYAVDKLAERFDLKGAVTQMGA